MKKNFVKAILLLLSVILLSSLFAVSALAEPPAINTPSLETGQKDTVKKAKKENVSDIEAKKDTLSDVQKKLSSKLLKLTDDQFLLPDETKKDLVKGMKKQRELILPQSEQSSDIVTTDTKVHVYIKLAKGTSPDILAPFLTGTVHKDSDGRLIAAWVNVESLNSIASLDGVLSITEVIAPVVDTGSILSEGDSALKADLMRAQTGADGMGIKVGIISDGADNWTAAKNKGDLPSDVTILRGGYYDDDGYWNGGDEGTAMMEIVHDLAPGAKLYFHDSGSDVNDFDDGINALVKAGCNIICDDIGWTQEPFFEDGTVAQYIANLLATKNIIYLTAAGNEADCHWQGTYHDDGYGFNDFSGGTSSTHKYIYATIPAGGSMYAVLEWNDPFGQSSNDYDMELFDTGSYILDSSLHTQNGSSGCDPLEVVGYENTSKYYGLDVEIDITKYHATSNNTLELYIYGADLEPYNLTTSDSIFGHAAVPGVVTCGAIDANPNDNGAHNLYCGQVEYFSSRGPVTMISGTRQKPDICGSDGVSVTGVGNFENPFYGTSAAAPHVAAVVALLESRFPGMPVSQIKQILLNNTDDLGASGYDNTYGNGKTDALASALSYMIVSFDSQGGSPVTNQYITKGSNASEPGVPTKSGCSFKGWYTGTDFDPSKKWDFSTAVNADTKLYAKWGPISSVISSGGTYDLADFGSGSTVNINNGLTVTLTNDENATYSNLQIKCGTGVTLTAKNLKISDSNANVCPLSFTGSGNSLILSGSNNMCGGTNAPGIRVETGTSLNISGTGSLTAYSSYEGAGIGGGNGKSCGSITITGGIINTNTSQSAAGIGGGYKGAGGNITITGGKVTACASNGAGIGGGYNGGGGIISITGGNVYAKGTTNDIGYGPGSSGGTLSISGDSAVFLGNGKCINPATTHVLVTTDTITDGIVFGRYEYSGDNNSTVYAYIDPAGLCKINYSGLPNGTITNPYYSGTTAVLKSNLQSGSQKLFGWNTKSDGTGKIYMPGSSIAVTGDITLYAMWTQMFSGSGTQSSPYQIGNVQQLYLFGQLVNSGNSSYDNKYYIQTGDIDLSIFDNWVPIGPFFGTYDGNGKKITEINIQVSTTDSYAYAGLFSYVMGTVKNLTISGGTISVTSPSNAYGGGIAGCLVSGTVQNCSSSINISVTSSADRYGYAGGITGDSENSNIINCSNSGSVSVDGYCGYAGGITGGLNNGPQLSGCNNSGDVCAQGCTVDAGGIVGQTFGDESQLINVTSCVNSGDISIKNNINMATCAGIVGDAYCSKISNCSNSGNLYGENNGDGAYYGGIVGFCSDKVTISNCDNSGGISSEVDKSIVYCGGIAGSSVSYANLAVTGCYNTGGISIVSNRDWACSGGIVGYDSYGSISKCYNTGNLSIVSSRLNVYSGGLVGYAPGASSDYLSLTDCFNSGNLNINNKSSYSAYLGGFIGEGGYTNMARCYNTGLIIGNADYYGGGAGWLYGTPAFANCFYASTCSKGIGYGTGTVTSKTPAQLRQKSTFTGYDFTNTWSIIDGSDGLSVPRYPMLRNLPFTYTTGVSLDLSTLPLDVGASKALTPTIAPSGASDRTLIWTSSNTSFVTVDNTGTVKLVADGSATVTVTTDDGGFTAACNVSTRIPVTSVTLNKETLSLEHHSAETLIAAVLPGNASYPAVTWSSSDESVATVDQNGKVTAVAVGNALITAKAENITDTCSVEVTPKHVISVKLNNDTLSIVHHSTGNLNATVFPTDASYPQVTWKSDDVSVATVDQNGKITAISPGSTKITATAAADVISASCDITVTPKRVSSVTLTCDSIKILLGGNQSLSAVVLPADSTYPQVTWTSSDESVATVDQNGTVTAHAWGNTTIKAEADGQSASCTVRVNVPFKLTFNTNGGSQIDTQTVNYGELALKPNDPSRTGYDFAGWYKDNSTFQDAWYFGINTMPYSDTDLYANWTAKSYTVKLDPAGGTASSAQIQVTFDQAFGELPVPTRTGYYFYGWYTGTNGSGTLTDKTTIVKTAANFTLYAKWVKNSSVALSTPSLSVKSIDYKTVMLTWNAVPKAKGYEIYKKIGNIYTYLTTVDGALSYSDAGLTKGTKYYYEVKAYWTPYQTKAYSSFSTPKYAAPVWPSITLNASSKSYTSVSLSWNAITGATGYEIWTCSSAKGPYTVYKDMKTITSYTDENLNVGQAYYYEIVPYDDAGGSKVYGTPSGYKSAKPAWPVINLTAATKNYYSISLNWNEIEGADKYDIYRSTSSGTGYSYIATVDKGTGSVASCIDSTGLVTNKAYYYKVMPYDLTENGSKYGPYSSYKSAKPAWPAINLIAESNGYNSVKLTWNEIDGADKYDIYRNTSSSGTYTKVGTVDKDTAAAISYIDSNGLTPGKTYYYRIMPIDSVNSQSGPYSTYKSVKPVPSVPAGLQLSTDTVAVINLKWDAVEGAEGYEIYRATSPKGSYIKITTVLDPDFDNTGLTAGKTYYYKVRAYCTAGTSSIKIYGNYSEVQNLKI